MDFVTHQASKAAEGAARYLEGKNESNEIHTIAGENVGYVVPGRLHANDLPNVIEFFFRVRKPMDAGTIIVRSGDKVIRSLHKEKLIPSVMEQLILAGKQLEGLSEDLVVEVKED